MEHAASELDRLLDQAIAEPTRARDAVSRLIFDQREWLVPFVRKALDPRLAPRLDPNDVVQEVLMDAVTNLPRYLQTRHIPFGAWLSQIALERVAHAHRRHIKATKRSVCREAQQPDGGSPESGTPFERVPDHGPAPSSLARRDERAEKLHAVLEQLSDAEREMVFAMCGRRHLVPTREIAAQLGITESAVRTRRLRLLSRLHDLLGKDFLNVT